MDGIKDVIRKRLSLQHRGKNMIGSIATNEIRSQLNIQKIDPEVEDEVLTGYVKHEKLFIKTLNQSIKIQIFKDKSTILKKINKKLSEIGYKTQIQDIVLK